MKKTTRLLSSLICLFTILVFVFTGCNVSFTPVTPNNPTKAAPVYKGMFMSTSANVEIPADAEVSVEEETSVENAEEGNKEKNKDKENNGNTDNNGNHTGWYKDDNGDGKVEESSQEQLCYISQNQDVYFYIGISNPDKAEIRSIKVGGKTYTSDMFEANSTDEVKVVKYNVGIAGGMVEYTLEEIKYFDGNEEKNVAIEGNNTAKAAIKVENAVKAIVTNIELKDSGKEAVFNVTVTDEFGLIALSNGNIKITVYRDGKDKKEAELTVGENTVTFKTLNKNKAHQYEIVAFYDDLSGAGATYHTLIAMQDLEAVHVHTFGEWEITVPATCTTDGEQKRICSVCGESETETISAYGEHSFGAWKITKEATCQENGEETRTCSICQVTETKTFGGDHFFGAWVETQKGNCIINGEWIRTCLICKITETKIVPAPGEHVFGPWIIMEEATYDKEGLQMRICENCNAIETEAIPVLKPIEPVDSVLTIEQAIALGASQGSNIYTEGKYYVTGVITEIVNVRYGNLYITDGNGNTLYLYGLYNYDGSVRFDSMYPQPGIGDTITVYGVLGQYANIPQMKNGWVVEHYFNPDVTTPEPEPEFTTPEPEETTIEPPIEPDVPGEMILSITEAINLALSQEHNVYTSNKYYVTGIITEVYNTQYGNMKITDGNGNILTVYGSYNADGTVRYDKLNPQPVVGDIITVYGVIGHYLGTPQVKNGWIIAHTSGSIEETTPAPDVTTPMPDEPDVPVEPELNGNKIVGVIADIAAENGWVNGTRYESFTMGGNVIVSAAGTPVGTYGLNTGKYYTASNTWRFYQNENPELTIATLDGRNIVSVKITYEVLKTGIFTLNGVYVESDVAVVVNANSVTFGVGNTDIATNGQVRVTAIEVVLEVAECETHDYGNRFDKKWGICLVCGYVDDNHEHSISNDKCVYCDYEYEEVEVSSYFDYDGNGVNDVFYFSAALPERFTCGGVIWIDAVNDIQGERYVVYDEVKNTSYLNPMPYAHVYLQGREYHDELVYTVYAETAGLYEMAIHTRLKDCRVRGAQYVINKGTANEYTFSTTYGWASDDEAYAVRNNDFLVGAYMSGMFIELQEGENTIHISMAEGVEKSQFFRDFYFIPAEKIEIDGCDHNFVDGICEYCGYIRVIANASVYDNDGDGVNDIYFFTPVLPEQFTTEDVVHVWAGDYIVDLSSSYVSSASFNDIRHWYCTEGKGEFFTIKVTVAEPGIYEMAVHMRMKDSKERGAKYIVNEGTSYEYSFETSFQFATDEEAFEARDNDYAMSSYMFGIPVKLVAGDNYIRIQESTKSPKVQHFRDFYFVKIGEWEPDVTPVDPPADSNLTVEEAINLGASKDHNTYTAGKYYVTGVITEVYNSIYGNMRITDGNGNILTVYGTYSADGSIRYDQLDNKPIVGDTVTIYGIIGQYNGTAQIKNGWIVAHFADDFECVEHDYGNRFDKKWGICLVCGYVDDNHEHSISNGKCVYCDYEYEEFEVASIFDNDADGMMDIFYFSAALPERFIGENIIWVDAVNDVQSSNYTHYDPSRVSSTTEVYSHVYCTENANQELAYVINVETAGIYELAVYVRLKDNKLRGARYTINKGTANEYTFSTSYGWNTTEEAIEVRNNDLLIGSYMSGIFVKLQAGENTIHITDANPDVVKVQHFRDLYFRFDSYDDCYGEHNYGNRFDKKWGICLVCGYVDDNHEHSIVDGKCQYCDYEFEEFEVPSIFDNDDDGAVDVFYFSAALPERFTGEDVIWVDAYNDVLTDNHMSWDPIGAGITYEVPYPHVYCVERSDDELVYTINVKKAGTYEMAVHYRIKDEKTRGAKFVINGGTANEQVINHTYSWATADDAYEVRNNDILIGSYMSGMFVELQAGENTIHITCADGVEKAQHFRDLYFRFVKEIDECETHDYGNRFEKKWGICVVCGYVDDNHEHSIKDGKCVYCDYEFEVIEVSSVFDNDADGMQDVFYFSAALPEEFTGEDVIWIDAFNDVAPGNHMEYDEVRAGIYNPLPYPHVYCLDSSDDELVYTINVEEAGIYEMAVHYRIKDNKVRGAKFVINGGTANEQVINHTYSWATADDAYEVRNNDILIGAYMTGLTVELVAGENTIHITCADGVVKPQHFRDFYFVLVETEECSHSWVDATCTEPKTCTKCGATEGQPLEHVWVEVGSAPVLAYCIQCGETIEMPQEHVLDDSTYMCIICGQNFLLTVEEAIEIGMSYEKSKYGSQYYYVALTLNAQVNPNGFARAQIADGLYVTVAGGYLSGDAEGSIQFGDTVIFKAKLGAANSALTTGGKELRLYEVASYEITVREDDECTTHDYGNRFEKKWGICVVCGYVDDNHEHSIKDGKCVYCDYEYEVIEVLSVFDNDADGMNDVFYFSAALPEEFTGEDVIWVDAYNDALKNSNHMEYDEIRAGAGKLPYPHVYCYDVSDDELVYTINVEKAGIYEMAVHYRIKDNKVRGAKFTINKGTANEQVINHTYGWATTDEAYEVRNNDFLIGAYMSGMLVELQAGENTIHITCADGVTKTQHFRDLYFRLAEENTETVSAPLTVEEAIAIGLNYDKSTYSTEEYYVIATLNLQCNANGFARVHLGDDLYMSIASGYLEYEGQLQLGDTVLLKGNLGAVNSALSSTGKEARLFNVELIEIISSAPEA